MTKTTCQRHRVEGYYTGEGGVWLCRVCGLPQSMHETTDETLARKRAEAEAETIARATGSTGATVRYETRHLDGTLTVDAEGSWSV